MRIPTISLAVVVAALAVSCAAPAATPTPAPTQAVTPAPTAAPTSLADLGPIRIGVEAPGGEAYIPTQLTVKRMKDMGYDIEIVMFEDPDIMPQALDAGDININTNSSGQILSAIDAGLDVKAIQGLTNPDFVMVADKEHPTCASLDGAKIAAQGTTGFGFASVVNWLKRDCPEAQPEMIDIPGSENRAVALLEGQINATSLHLLRALQLQQAKPGEFVIIDGYGSGPGVTSAWQYSLTSWINANPELYQAYVETYEQVVADIEANPQLAIDEGVATIPDAPADLVTQVMQSWAENDTWTASDGLTREVFDATLAFYLEFTDYETDLTYEMVVLPPNV
jgi:NitT/TauT family transport system substrate-binding protein